MGYRSAAPRVVLVEDDADSRQALRRLLEEAGFEVEEAGDGGEGVMLVRTLRPDVVLMDLVLPGMSGFEAANALKEDQETSRIPLVAVTASWLGAEASRLRGIGFDGALRKPFGAATLLHEIRRVLP